VKIRVIRGFDPSSPSRHNKKGLPVTEGLYIDQTLLVI